MRPTDIGAAVEAIRDAHRITVLTGAGVSAASGVPTFRGAGGLWHDYRPEDLANAEAFDRDPRLVWQWYDWRRQLIAGCRPNRAHEVLAAWSHRLPTFTLLTQNVDGLHERAGTARVVRLHGSIWRLKCRGGCGYEPDGWTDYRVPIEPLPPACPSCSGLARPGVVWFGEALDPWDLARAEAVTACDLFLTVGTSSVVYPAAGFAGRARANGAMLLEINPDRTAASDGADIVLRLPAEEALEAIEARLGAA